jgi:serine/threonine protein kinase
MLKIKMFKQLIDHQKILILGYGIIHNDIKPSNIVVDENNNLSLIDYGITYFVPRDIYCFVDFDTTYYSACHEYYLIGVEQYNNNNSEFKLNITYQLYYKSQHYALASIMIGMLLNDFDYYGKTFNKIFFYNPNKENCGNMIIRYKDIDEKNTKKFISVIKNKLLKNRKNYDKYCTYDKIVDIIMNMIIFDNTKKQSLSEISKNIDEVLNDKNNLLYDEDIISSINELFIDKKIIEVTTNQILDDQINQSF